MGGDGPLACFPHTAIAPGSALRSQALAKHIYPLHLRCFVKQLGSRSLGVAFVFNEVDPMDPIETEVAAFLQANFAINEEVLKGPKAYPRTLLPEAYKDYLDLCTPYCKKPHTDRKFEI